MKETLISGKFLFSGDVLYAAYIATLGYIVLASGGLNPAISGLQDYVLRHTDRYISSLLLAAVIAAAT